MTSDAGYHPDAGGPIVLRRRRPLTAVAIAAVATLWLAGGLDRPPLVTAADAASHEGQEVRVQGAVADVSVRPDGSGTVLLRQAGHGIEVFVDRADGLHEGAWVEATGRLFRWDGRLVMEAVTTSISLPQGPRVQLPAIAAEPASWTDRPIALRGVADGARIHDAGHTIPITGYRGEGPVEAHGVLAYHDACLCYRFHVHEARPWTPQ